jgi:WD40 repeat protein
MLLLKTKLNVFDHRSIGLLAFSPDSSLLAGAGLYVPGVELWRLPSGEPGPRLKLPPSVHYFTGLFFSGDSRLLVGGWDGCAYFNPQTGGKQRGPAIAWGGLRGHSPDGRYLVLSSGRGNDLRVRLVLAEPPSSPKVIWDKRQPNLACRQAAVTPEGRTIGVRSGKTLVLWDAGGTLQLEAPCPSYLGALVVTPGGKRLLGLTRRSILVWEDIDLKRRPRRISSNTTREVNGLAVHPGGDHALLASNDGTVKVCDLRKRAVVREYRMDLGPLIPVAVSPDGNLAATAAGETVVVWDLEL